MEQHIVLWVTYVAAFVLGVGGTARLTRLITQDAYPPARWLREKWVRIVRGDEEWSILMECPWCFAPYAAAANLAWAVLSDLHWSWWIVNLWLTGAYLASWVVIHDEDE